MFYFFGFDVWWFVLRWDKINVVEWLWELWGIKLNFDLKFVNLMYVIKRKLSYMKEIILVV